MKVAILAGGFGTRLSEETDIKPKPMVEIGGKPILWHIMKHYSHYGHNEFVILLGYKGYYIKEYFANYFLHQSDVTFDIKNNKMEIHNNSSEPWKVTLVDTGLHSMTGGRVLRAKKFLDGAPFLLTYGDGVSDVDINKLISFHEKNKRILTLTAVMPEGRFGALNIQNDLVTKFLEKPKGDGSWINGGFFVCQPDLFSYIKEGDATIFERSPMEMLANDSQMVAFKHEGFWKPMDTLRDKHQLETMWEKGQASWKVWAE
jgi:glucose-1-phosphate cytidylyltransferase